MRLWKPLLIATILAGPANADDVPQTERRITTTGLAEAITHIAIMGIAVAEAMTCRVPTQSAAAEIFPL